MPAKLRRILTVPAAAVVFACGDETPTNGAISFAADIQPIFTSNCALSGCHTGSQPQAGQNLSVGQAYANIVNVPSTTLPSMDRVEPNLPDQSFLVHKIQGTQGPLGSNMGERMPFGGDKLPQSTIDLIRAWIMQGANNN